MAISMGPHHGCSWTTHKKEGFKKREKKKARKNSSTDVHATDILNLDFIWFRWIKQRFSGTRQGQGHGGGQWIWTHRWVERGHRQGEVQPSRPIGSPRSSWPALAQMTRRGSSRRRQTPLRPRCWLPQWNQSQLGQWFPFHLSWGPLLWRTLCRPGRKSSRSRTPGRSTRIRRQKVRKRMFPTIPYS